MGAEYGNLRGRTVVVTGGNGGIGLALAHGVGRAGASVSIWGRNAAKNDAAQASLEAEGITAHATVCDVSEAEVDAAMAATLARFGSIDTLFANAGVAGAEVKFIDLSLEEWRALMGVDVDGAFLSLRAAAKIRCNSLAPGWTDTTILAPGGSFGASDHDRFRAATIRRTPVRRWAAPDDFGAIAAFLADPTLVFHTGDTLVVDGGYSIA
jgi:NAD(P)-dependent dehydrogenase (short-subunit alcohol dehydrogenase family)